MPKTTPGVYRRNGAWAYRTQWRDGDERRSLSGSGYRTAGEAAAALEQAKKEAAAMRAAPDRLAVSSTITLGEWLDIWLARCQVKVSTLGDYRQFVSYIQRDRVARVGLRKLTEADLIQLVGRMQQHLAHDTVKARMGKLRMALNYAVRRGVIAASPATGVKVVRQTPKPLPQFWDTDQARTFLTYCRAAGDPLYPMYRLALATGMRKGELLGLHWSEVDLAAGTVRVMRNRTMAGTKVVELTPKTDGSEDTLAVDAATLAALGTPGRGYVFRQANGRPWHPGMATKQLTRSAMMAGVPAIKFHALRHTAATIMAEDRIPMSVAKERLRHWSESMTAVYTHVSRKLAKGVADRMGELLADEGPVLRAVGE